MVKLKDQNKKMLVELIHHEGFADADEKFKSEMLMLAGMPDKGGAHVRVCACVRAHNAAVHI